MTRLRVTALCTPLYSAFCAWAPMAKALPIGFGANQGSISYSEIKNDHFYIYHDSRTPTEGAIALDSLDHARPHLERWLEVERTEGLPVIVSDVTSNASFANFITDALEVQTGGGAQRDLFLHEYVHSSMYRHFDWLFGPPGSVLHLPWMPAWFIEGLAESLSVSVGSDVQAGIERYQALSGDWPTYDRLHSLYGKYDFALRGYATSGSLVSYILRQGNADHLAKMMREYYAYTKPWWWFWAAVPFNGFMPMDRTLENFVKYDGKTLYERYKKDAAAFWKAKSPSPLLVKRPGLKRDFSGFYGFRSVGNDLRFFVRVDDRLEDHVMQNGKSGWVEKSKKVMPLPLDFKSGVGFFNKELQAMADNEIEPEGFELPGIKLRQIEGKVAKVSRFKTSGSVLNIWDTPEAILWWEQNLAKTSICFLLKQDLKLVRKHPTCSFTLEQPKALDFLGARLVTLPNKDIQAKEIWFNIVEQTLVGDRSQILIFDATERRIRTIDTTAIGHPIAAAFAANGIWVLSAERGVRTIRKIEGDGRCIGMITPSDHVLNMWGHADGSLSLGLFGGLNHHILRLSGESLKLSSCTTPTFHSSPLIAAMGSISPLKLTEAMARSSYWQLEEKGKVAATAPKSASPSAAAAKTTSEASEKTARDEQRTLQDAAALGEGAPEAGGTAGPAKWRGRTALVGVPWIGGEDYYGTQVGVISIPIMDHMQNDTVRATFLYGTESRFPNTEISYLNTRFWPTLKLDVYRAQTYNGVVTYTNSKTETLYYEEKGVRASSIWSWLNNGTNFGLSVKSAQLDPYVGRTDVRRGRINEFRSNLSKVKKLSSTSEWSGGIDVADVPSSINDEFDYNELGFRTGFAKKISLFQSTLSTGVETSRTRGKKMRVLKQMYQPLKTFIPGSGGGYNQLNFGILGPGSLFNSRFGDSQGRLSGNWVIPLIPDFDKLLWIFYIDRLDLTAFVNYGGAWTQKPLPSSSELIGAHGYNFDLQFDLKGIRFSLGLGTGQVFGSGFDVYSTFSFDAIF